MLEPTTSSLLYARWRPLFLLGPGCAMEVTGCPLHMPFECQLFAQVVNTRALVYRDLTTPHALSDGQQSQPASVCVELRLGNSSSRNFATVNSPCHVAGESQVSVVAPAPVQTRVEEAPSGCSYYTRPLRLLGQRTCRVCEEIGEWRILWQTAVGRIECDNRVQVESQREVHEVCCVGTRNGIHRYVTLGSPVPADTE